MEIKNKLFSQELFGRNSELPNQKPIEIQFHLLGDEITSIQWRNKLQLHQINVIKAAILACSNYTIPCFVEDTKYPSEIIAAELVSTRLLYDDNNQITNIWGYFQTKDVINNKIIKFIVLIDNETNDIDISLNK